MRRLKRLIFNNQKLNIFFPLNFGEKLYFMAIFGKRLFDNKMLLQFIHSQHRLAYFFNALIIPHWIIVGFLYIILGWYFTERAQAFDLTEDIQLHGFITQGYFLTSDNRIFGKSDEGGSFDYTEAGITGSWTPHSDFRFAAQVLFRRAGIGHKNDFELDFGLLDYTILSTVDYRLGVRLGRVKLPFGFYNETRDVLFTRPTILLPQSIYADAQRDLALSADGGLFYGEYRNDWGNMSLELGAGKPRGDSIDVELGILGDNFPGETYSELSYVGRLGYETQGGKFRMAITSARVDTRYDPKLLPPDDLLGGKDIFIPVIFSGQYNREKLSLTAEYAFRSVEDTGFGSGFDRKLIGESYYLQAEYRFRENWHFVLRYDVMYNDRNDKSGRKNEAKTGSPAHTWFAKDWTIGLRHYINPSFLIAAEYHSIDGTAWIVPIQDNPDPFDLKRRWNLFALAVSYRF